SAVWRTLLFQRPMLVAQRQRPVLACPRRTPRYRAQAPTAIRYDEPKKKATHNYAKREGNNHRPLAHSADNRGRRALGEARSPEPRRSRLYATKRLQDHSR